jgi:hypothetical protein
MSFEKGILASARILARIRAKLALLATVYRADCILSGLHTESTEQHVALCGSAFLVARDPITLSQRPLTVIFGFDQTGAGPALIVSLGVPGVGYQVVYLDAVKPDRDFNRILEEATVETLRKRLDPAFRQYLEPVNPKHWSPRKATGP